MTVDRNILPGMKPTRHSFRCGQPLGPGVAHHGMRNLVHHAQAHVASPRGERLPAQVADHLSDAAYVVIPGVIPVASVPGRSALNELCGMLIHQDGGTLYTIVGNVTTNYDNKIYSYS